MAIKNVMEDVVRDVLLKYGAELHLTCRCERCFDDIMALSLNQLPPRYIVNSELSPYVRAAHEADRQGATTILSAVAHAASRVAKSPRCNSAMQHAAGEETLVQTSS